MDEKVAIDALARQLHQSAEVVDELRLLLKEDRQKLAFRELECENLTKHVHHLEGQVAELRRELFERDQRLERLSVDLNKAQARLRAFQASRWWPWHQRMQTARRVKQIAARSLDRRRRRVR